MKPQDLKFTKAELDKCFGPRMTHKQFLKQFKKKYSKVKAGD
jgi:hypothetical protein